MTDHPTRRTDLGHAIRVARELRAWSQEKLADEAARVSGGKMSPTTVRSYEREGAIVGKKFRAIARALEWPHDADERLAQGDDSFVYANSPLPDVRTDYHSGGGTFHLTQDVAALYAQLREDHADFVREQLEPLGDVEIGGMADMILRTEDGREFIVEVKSSRPTGEDEIVRDIGMAAELQVLDMALLIVALVDWPQTTVERLERMGAIYATPADVVKKLTTIGEQ